jgi:hypothetical protein
VAAALVERLRDDNQAVRSAAAGALGKSGAVAVTPAILDQLATMIYSPEARGSTFEDVAFTALSRLLLFSQGPAGVEAVPDPAALKRSQEKDRWLGWLAGAGEPSAADMLPRLALGYPVLTVRKAQLRNIKVYEDSGPVDLTLPDGGPRMWTLLLGDNAAGKTTFLKCVALAAHGAGPANEMERNAAGYLRAGAKRGFIEVQFGVQCHPDAVPAELGEIVVGLEIRENDTAFRPMNTADLLLSGRANSAERLGLLRSRADRDFGLVCAYGALRGLTDDPTALSRSTGKVSLDRVAPLFRPDVPLIDPAVLGKLLATGDLSNFRDAPPRLDEAIRAELVISLCALLPGVGMGDPQQPTHLRLHETAVPIRELSEGYGSFLALLGHLLHHTLAVTGWARNPAEVSGVVLIDEVDLHLHPGWQRRVAEDLRKAFPNVQFLTTSHSPMLAGGVAENELRVLQRAERGVVISSDVPRIRGWRADQILTSDLFGLSTTRDMKTEDLLTRYAGLLNERGPDDPEVKELSREIGQLSERAGEGSLDEQTHALLKAVAEQQFRQLDEKARQLVIAKAGLLLGKGKTSP